MERMTIPDVKIDENTTRRSVIDAAEVKKCAMQLYWHLKKIEDIIADDESEEYDLDRLRELVEADREGRCVMLPCKVGDTVFQINQTDVFEIGIKKLVYDCGQVAFDETAIGVSIFTDREAAEAALKKEE